PRQPYANPVSWAPMNAHKVPSRSMAIENLMNSQKTALLRPRVLQEAPIQKVMIFSFSALPPLDDGR
ncbi:MAG: hypothetical protein Q8S00_11365, partial [Deltaproteobacteria bacterium]|nr:hypothetical protein [Deltaproteobacteria bacterium]MDZ4341802.1 hypothetical protein [Candidatus Binatia bacterium]